MPLILLTNDDGINAPGLAALRDALAPVGTVYTVAPDRERSAAGHSLTIDRPLKVTRLEERIYMLNGTPTDCVAIGAAKVMPARPDIVISGINNGPNLGDDITYSGTVSAAMEGTIMSITSVAISLNVTNGQKPLFETAALHGASAARFVLEHNLPYDTLINVNVPNLPADHVKGVRITRQGKRVYDGAIQNSASPWGENFYWIGGGKAYWEHGDDTDMNAVLEGYVSVCPLHLDLTNYGAMDFLMERIGKWNTNT